MGFKNYRDFLKARLRAEGLSYRAFTERHARAVGLPALSQLLSNPRYRMGNEAFHRLIRALRLRPGEEAHLLFLKLEGDVQMDVEGAEDLRRAWRALGKAVAASVEGGRRRHLGAEAQAIGELFEILPGYLKIKFSKYLLAMVDAFAHRNPRAAALDGAQAQVDVVRQIARTRS